MLKKSLSIILAITSISAPCLAIGSVKQGVVVRVIDGDTVLVQNGNIQTKIRLASIDAPELAQTYGIESKKALTNLIGDKSVRFDCPTIDKYNRLICTITEKGLDINKQMVLMGAAWVYRYYYKGTDYIEAENHAKRTEVGIWQSLEYYPIAPWQWRKAKRTN